MNHRLWSAMRRRTAQIHHCSNHIDMNGRVGARGIVRWREYKGTETDKEREGEGEGERERGRMRMREEENEGVYA
jgi:hypothetical protein